MTHKTKRERKYAASFKFERLAALNAMQDAGDEPQAARKAKAKMNDTWTKRTSKNVRGFHRPQ